MIKLSALSLILSFFVMGCSEPSEPRVSSKVTPALDTQGIALCMQYNQRKKDSWWSQTNAALAEAEGNFNSALNAVTGGSYASSQRSIGCSPYCSGPDEFRYQCTSDITFIWSSAQ